MSTPRPSTRVDRRWVIFGALVPVMLALDQLTKQLADSALAHRPDVLTVVDGFFLLRYSRNRGAFFSIGEALPDGMRLALFIGATTLAIGFMVWLYRRARREQRALRWALTFLTAGAIGNLVDRVLYGEVIDFLHLHYRDVFHWATFNVADIYICAGLVLLIRDMFSAPAPVSTPPSEAKSA